MFVIFLLDCHFYYNVASFYPRGLEKNTDMLIEGNKNHYTSISRDNHG